MMASSIARDDLLLAIDKEVTISVDGVTKVGVVVVDVGEKYLFWQDHALHKFAIDVISEISYDVVERVRIICPPDLVTATADSVADRFARTAFKQHAAKL